MNPSTAYNLTVFGTLVMALPAWLSGPRGRGNDRVARSTARDTRPIPSTDLLGDALLTRLRAGDQTALRDAYATHAAELWRHAYRYLGDRDLAEDVVQDVFVAVWERRGELSAQLALRPYLFAAVRNRALKRLRHGAVVEGAERGDLENQRARLSDLSELTEIGARESTLISLVRRALDELPERQRTAIELRWLRGLNHTEIAAVLGVSEAAVRKLVIKALGRLETLHRWLQEP